MKLRVDGASVTVQSWAAPIRKGAEIVAVGDPPAAMVTPPPVTSRVLVEGLPAPMVTETGVSAVLVEASKVSDLILRLPWRAVVIAAPPVRLSAMNFTSEPGPGVEVAGVKPSLLTLAQFPRTFQSSLAPPAVQ